MDAVLNEHTIYIFRQPPEDVSSIFLWNAAPQATCYSNLNHIMFLHHYENLYNELQKISDKIWMVLTGKIKWLVHMIFFYQHSI
jgi:hypothetical protein